MDQLLKELESAGDLSSNITFLRVQVPTDLGVFRYEAQPEESLLRVNRREPGRPWGGLVLQGRGTEGSRLTHVVARGGSAPHFRSTRYPGMINLHDTRDVAIEGCRFGANRGTDDVVHAAYVSALRVEDSVIVDAHRDACRLSTPATTGST